MSEHSPKDAPGHEPGKQHATNATPGETQEKPGIPAYRHTPANDIKQYIEAATDATERSRRVLIILITASVLTLVATWNSREGSWFNERYKLTNAASKLFADKNKPIPPTDRAIVELKEKEGVKTDLYERAHEYINKRHITHQDRVTNAVDKLEEQRLEQVTTVRMPFFGVGFDINDMGIFAGFTFVVVLLWFRFSLLREVNNLRLTFYEARERDKAKAEANGEDGGIEREHLRFCYHMLAMRQVLTTPRMPPQAVKNTDIGWLRQGFWFFISKSLFLLPLIVQAIVMTNDKRSIAVGRMISPRNTELVTVLSRIFVVAIVVLTVLCYVLVVKARMTWKEAGRELLLEGDDWLDMFSSVHKRARALARRLNRKA